MKGKIRSSKNRKMIALVATIAVLLTGTVTGVSLFLKDDGSASATGFENEVSNPTAQPSGNNPIQENPEQIPEDETEQEDGEAQGEQSNEGEINPDTQISGVLGTTSQGTTGTSATPQLPQESILYQDRLVAEDFLVGWTPIGVSAIADTMGRYINSPKLQIEKLSYTETDFTVDNGMLLPEETKYTAIQPGEMLIYEIRVSNIGNADAKDIKIFDIVPEGTTVIEIGADGIEKDGKIQWVSDIPAGAQVSFKFAVMINQEVEGNIKNVAVVNGDKTNETENAVIKTEKLATVTRDGKSVSDEARPGDVVTYTIKVTNTGNIVATTKATDILPAETTLVEESINENGKEENRIITWDEVVVEAGKTVELTFAVTINETVKEAIKNIATVGITDTNETENDVSNIVARKTVDKTEAKAGETLTYTITLSNSGNANGTVTVTDAIPEGTTIKDETVEGYNAQTNTMTWSDVEVGAGEIVELTLEVVIDEETTESVINTAILDGKEIPETPETKVANITGTKTVDKTEAKVGETLTYIITLINSGNANGIVTVTDAIPEGTTLKDETTEGYDAETNTMTWSNVEVGAGETVELTLEVVINGTTTTSVVNTAILDGKEIPEVPETKVANITATKASEADEPLKEMETIAYTITLHNSGNTAGKVTVTDMVPEGTTLVPNSVKIDGTVSNNIVLEDEKITWAEIEVTPEVDVVLSFEVTVNVFEGETITICNDKATIDGKQVNTTEDEAEKAYVEIEASKVWEDNENVAKKRPESIILIVKNNAGEVARKEVNADMDWKYTFERLPQYDSEGNEIEYTIDEEINSIFYEKNVEGNVVTNTFKVPDTKISIKASKVWNDNEDVAGKRPQSVVLIVKDATGEVARQEVNENIEWSYEFTDLPKYDDLGNEIEYTIDEEIDSIFYEKNVEGNVVTNTFKVPDTKINVSVEKVWDDNDDRAGKRPTSISVQLKANNVAEGQAVVLSGEGNVWNYTFENLAKYDANGDEISYTVEETVDSIFYVPEVTGDMTKYTITNTFEVPDTKVSVPVEKVWDDNDDRAEKRPTSISVQLKANNVAQGQAVVLNGEGNVWNYTFENLAKYDENGDEISYTVEETVDSIFYVPVVTGDMTKYTVTNTFEVPDTKVSVPVEKVWDDNDDRAGKRPTSISVQLKANNVVQGEAVVLSGEGNVWNYTFENLAKYDANGDEISYTVEETVDSIFYVPVVTGDMTKYTITNTFEVPDTKVSVPVEKVWDDNDDRAGKRPTSISVQLKANDVVQGQSVVLSGEGNVWNYTFENLAKYDVNGDEISYTVEETVDSIFYVPEVTGDMAKYTITNTFEVPDTTIDIPVEKIWNDNEDEAEKRPESIKVQVKVANEIAREVVIGSATEYGWNYTFNGLPKYDVNGNIINYTVNEVEVEEEDLYFYDCTTTGDMTKYTITNDFTVPGEETKILVEKVWDDNDDIAEKRPASVTLIVKTADGEVARHTVTEKDNWEYEFTLPKYDNRGNETIYTVDEAEVSQGDLYFYEKQPIDGYTITNKFTVPNETVDITINKTWVDTEAQQDKRPETITLQVKNGNTVVKSQEVSADMGWSYTFEDLPKYDANGNVITYTAGEVIDSKFYTRTDNETTTTVTNTFAVPDEKVNVPVEKVWDDNSNRAGKRPTSISVQLKANNVAQGQAVVLSGEGNVWNYTFENLAKYDENGDEISYTVEETVDSIFYVPEVTGDITKYTITNTFEVPDTKISVPVEKVWDDNDDRAGKRPTSISVQLKANNVAQGQAVVLSGEGNVWNYTFENLAKYDENGDEISYTVEETVDSIFYVPEVTGDMTKYTITNIFEVPDTKVSVPVEKVWNDNSNRAGKRPTSISVQLKANNVAEGQAVVLSGEGNVWNYTFENLAKYDANGDEISYTVEETVDSIFYVPEVTGDMTKYTITNTFEVPDTKIDVEINKIWVDTESQQDKRPETITLQVKNGNTVVDSHEVSANISWKYKFTGLAKYDVNGNEIKYTAGEVIDSKFYTRTDNGTTTTVTNTFTVPNETVDITINKVWVDTQAQQDKRPETIILQVKNGNTVVKSQEVSADMGWNYKFEDLPKYDVNGNEIKYTAGEVIDSKFYTRTDDGTTTTVTNTFTVPNEKTKLKVTKVWEDDGNTSARPNSIKVVVEGTAKETVLSGSKTDKNWSYEFTDLPKYDANGDEINYTVNEEEINIGDLENYSKNISGTTITNTYMPPVLTVAKISTTASPVRTGDTISYQIKVDNTGAGIARNVVIRDTLDLTKVEFVEASDRGVLNGNEVTWTIDSLAANTGTKTVTLTVKVKNTVKLGTEITNTATVDGGTTPSNPVKHKVETTVETLEKSESITGTNMVIVLDLSSSMNNKITNTQTRLDAAKDAAEAFINKVFPAGVTTGNQLSVVTFNYKNSSDQDAYNTEVNTAEKYKGTKVFTFTSGNANKTIATNESEATALIDEINNIQLGTNLGTNIAAALETTKTQVNALKALKPANRNVVIFLGDGAPSPYRKDGEWRSKYAGNVESNIVSLASQIKAIQNVPASTDITPVNTIIHTIGFGVTSTTDENYTQCCTNASNHNSHEHTYNSSWGRKTYVQDSYGYYYVEESDAIIATRILQRMSSGTGYYHLSDNGAGLLQNFNTIFTDTATVNGSMTTVNGIATKVLATQLDTSKSVTLTVNGVDKEVSYSNFAANGLTYTEVGTTYTLSWDVSQYDANTTLKITYNTK